MFPIWVEGGGGAKRCFWVEGARDEMRTGRFVIVSRCGGAVITPVDWLLKIGEISIVLWFSKWRGLLTAITENSFALSYRESSTLCIMQCGMNAGMSVAGPCCACSFQVGGGTIPETCADFIHPIMIQCAI
jgi:hypothetical protein